SRPKIMPTGAATVPTPVGLRPRVSPAPTNSASRLRMAGCQTPSRRGARAKVGATLVVAHRWRVPYGDPSRVLVPSTASLRRPLFPDHIHGRGTGDHQRQPAGMAAKVAGSVANGIRPQHAVTAQVGGGEDYAGARDQQE